MSHSVQHILRFFLPWACAGCRRPLTGLADHGFCGACWLALPRIQNVICHYCGIPLKDGGYSCYPCRTKPPPLLVRAAVEYRGMIPAAIHRFKYLGRKTLAHPLGVLLRQAWDQSPELCDVQGLVPVPLHPKNERLRGFNQAELLAMQLGENINRPVLSLLVRTRRTPTQVTRNRSERNENVQDAFGLHPAAMARRKTLAGCSFLLIDDVCTTASTLAECAKVLRRGGVKSVKSLVLARDL